MLVRLFYLGHEKYNATVSRRIRSAEEIKAFITKYILSRQLIYRDERSVCNIAKRIQRAQHQFSYIDKHRYDIYYGHKFCDTLGILSNPANEDYIEKII